MERSAKYLNDILQRYKSLAGFAIYLTVRYIYDAIYLRCEMPLWAFTRFISYRKRARASLYRILRSEIYRVAKQHIAKKDG